MIMASDVSSFTDESELELGLGLTLGYGCDGKAISGQSSSSLSSSSSSCSSPYSALNNEANVSAGTKRSADFLANTANVSQTVGWPPVGAYRINSFANQSKSLSPMVEKTHNTSGEKKRENALENEIVQISTFIKVNMDGIGIGRKIDLNAYSCYDTLSLALEEMFCKPFNAVHATTSGEKCKTMEETKRPSKLLDGSSEFVLTYEDKDGDLMLVGDVPWRMFLSSVKRLRIMRASICNK